MIEVDGKGLDSDLTRRQAIAYLPGPPFCMSILLLAKTLAISWSWRVLRSLMAKLATLDQVGLPSTARDQRLSDYSKVCARRLPSPSLFYGILILLLDEPTSGLDPRAIDEFHVARGLADQVSQYSW